MTIMLTPPLKKCLQKFAKAAGRTLEQILKRVAKFGVKSTQKPQLDGVEYTHQIDGKVEYQKNHFDYYLMRPKNGQLRFLG